MPMQIHGLLRWIPVAAICVSAAMSCSKGYNGYGYSPESEKMLEELDRTLTEKDIYDLAKNERINVIKGGIGAAAASEDGPYKGMYNVYDRLYDEYYQYNIDSAITYARKKQTIAELSGDRDLINDSMLDLADRYVLSGMFTEAFSLMGSIRVQELSEVLRPRYFHIYNSLYNGMCAASDDPVLRERYRIQRDGYRRMLYERLGTDDISRLYVLSEMMIDNGNAGTILDSLYAKYNSVEISLHEKAILSYIIGNVWLQCGNRDKSIYHYAESAIYDLRTPVNEYKSLHELAALLYENGDVRRAYRYITRSVNDAMTANARINIQSINRLLPIISSSYNIRMKENQQELRKLLAGISILAVLLAAAILSLVRVMKKVSVAERRTREKNDELQTLNGRLHEYIMMLQEANDIKESYLARYLDMCSDYIEGLERYRSHLRKSAKNGGFAEVMDNLKSRDFIEKELQEFYAQFDATFLDLFPDFIAQLNGLLQPDKRIEDTSKEGILSTELRVMALIRLGVNDSVKIAHFLRRSVSTIYNYRVKLRNAALSDREEFERQIMHMGRFGQNAVHVKE